MATSSSAPRSAQKHEIGGGLLNVYSSGGHIVGEEFLVHLQNTDTDNLLQVDLDFSSSSNLEVKGQRGLRVRAIVEPGVTMLAAKLEPATKGRGYALSWTVGYKQLPPDPRLVEQKLANQRDRIGKGLDEMLALHYALHAKGFDPFNERVVREALRDDGDVTNSAIDLFFPPVARSIGNSTSAHAWRRAVEILHDDPTTDKDETAVFFQSVNANDIVQGELGNCWFLSALASLVEFPEMVDRIFCTAWPKSVAAARRAAKPMYDDQGLYKLRFCMHGQWMDVLLDDYFPCKGPMQGPVFSRAHGPELWVMLVEKAYAKLQGSYWNCRLGLPNEGLLDLTGAPTIRLRFDESEVSFDDLWSWDRNSCVVCADSSTDSYVDGGLVPGHAYTVLQVRQIQQGYYRGAQVLQIRSPWGRFEWGGDWSNESPQLQACRSELEDDGVESTGSNGQFWMSFNDFKLYFASVSVCALYVLQPGSTLANPQYLTSTPDLSYVGTGERYVPPRLNWRSATGWIEGERFVPRRWEEYRIKSLFETSGAAGEARLRPAHCFHLVVPTPQEMHETLMFTLSQVKPLAPWH